MGRRGVPPGPVPALMVAAAMSGAAAAASSAVANRSTALIRYLADKRSAPPEVRKPARKSCLAIAVPTPPETENGRSNLVGSISATAGFFGVANLGSISKGMAVTSAMRWASICWPTCLVPALPNGGRGVVG